MPTKKPPKKNPKKSNSENAPILSGFEQATKDRKPVWCAEKRAMIYKKQ